MQVFTVGAVSLISVLPALALGWYLYVKDRGEKEPAGLLALFFLAGAASFAPLQYLERLAAGVVDAAFERAVTVSDAGLVAFGSGGARAAHHLLCAFAAVALLEEGVRWGLLVLVARKSRGFGCLFDGVAYAVFLSLGCAAAECLRFTLANGWDRLFVRAVTAVPAHLLFGILMGAIYSLRRVRAAGGGPAERAAPPAVFFALSLLAPLTLHGVFAFLSLEPSRGAYAAYLALTAALCALAFEAARRTARTGGAAERKGG